MAEISIILQNSDGQEYIEKCLASLYKQDYTDFEVIVIDHSSMDDSPNIVLEKFPEAKLYVIEGNKGFSYGINFGVSKVDSEYVVLMNSTTYPASGWLSALLKCISGDSRIFSASSKLLCAENPGTVENIGYSLTLSGIVKKIGNGKANTKFMKKRKLFSSSCDGAIYRRSVLGIAGGFDDSFFTCLDDIDVSYRAFLCGFYSVFCPDAIAYTAKSREHDNFMALLSSRNKIYMFYKNMPLIQRAVNSPFIVMGKRRQRRYYIKKGLKKYYNMGIVEGNKNKRRLCINKRHKRPLSRHIIIQAILIKNSIAGIFGR